MKVTSERLDNCQIHMIIELDAAEIDKRLRATARKISREFTVPGYRRGKAPFHAVIRVFGREAVQQQGLEEFGNELYDKGLEEIEYEPYDVGELKEVEWDPFRMTVLLPIVPEVDLGDYRSVRVPFEPEPVTDEQIDEYLANVRQEYAQWVPVERPAALGDQVVIDMVGHAGDQEIMNNKGYEMILDEEATYPLPGFHQAIVGLSPGEEKTFELPVPEEDADEAAAGQVAEIRVHLHTVKEEDVPPLDDELALMVGDYDTLEDLKAGVQQDMETKAWQQAESEYLDKVLEAMVEAAAKVEYPPQAIDREADMALNQMERNLASSGMQLDSFLGMIGKTRETYKQELRPASEERLQKRLVLNEIAKLESLEVADEEVEGEIDRMSEMLGEQAGQMREMLESPIGRLSVTEDLLITKSQERVIQIGKGEAPPLPEAEEVIAEAEAEAGEPASEAEPETQVEPEAVEAAVVEAEPAEDAEPEAVAAVAEEAVEAEAEAGEPASEAEPETQVEPEAVEAAVVEAEPAEDAESEAVAAVAEEAVEAEAEAGEPASEAEPEDQVESEAAEAAAVEAESAEDAEPKAVAAVAEEAAEAAGAPVENGSD